MEIIAIDPGLTTGVAIVSEGGALVHSCLFTQFEEVIWFIYEHRNDDVHVVIEDFVGAGPRTTEAIYVLKLIGGIVGALVLCNLEGDMQAPQVRIPFVPDATRRAPSGTSKHIIDAYAHALAYLERVVHAQATGI